MIVVKFAAPGGALNRSLDPEGAAWTAETYLFAAAVDLLAGGNWQRAGDKRKKRPDPVPRPNQKKTAKKPSLTQRALQGEL